MQTYTYGYWRITLENEFHVARLMLRCVPFDFMYANVE